MSKKNSSGLENILDNLCKDIKECYSASENFKESLGKSLKRRFLLVLDKLPEDLFEDFEEIDEFSRRPTGSIRGIAVVYLYGQRPFYGDKNCLLIRRSSILKLGQTVDGSIYLLHKYIGQHEIEISEYFKYAHEIFNGINEVYREYLRSKSDFPTTHV